MLPQSRSPRVDGYLNLSLFRLMDLLASVHGLKNELYSCVGRRLRDCGTAGLRDCGSSFSSKIFGGPGISQSSHGRFTVI